MADTRNDMKEHFDFSKDAVMFRQKLWLQLKARMAASPVRALDDDELSMIHAAGMVTPPDEDDCE